MTGLRSDLAALLAMALFPTERSGPYVIELPDRMRPRRPEPAPRQQYPDDPRTKEWREKLERERLEKEAQIQAIRDERKKRKAEQWKKQHPHEQ